MKQIKILDNKIVYLIIGGIIFLVIFALFFSNTSTKSQDEPVVHSNLDISSPIPVIINSFYPENNSQDVSAHKILRIEGKDEQSINRIRVETENNSSFTMKKEGNILFLIPRRIWTYGKTYKFHLIDNMTNTIVYNYTITIEGISALENTSEQLLSLEQKVANQTPYAEDTFSVVSDYDAENKKFNFIIEVPYGIIQETAETNFHNWLISLGVPKEKISSFSAEYIKDFRK